MIRELKQVSQREGEAPRRWFGSEYFDLIVWYEDDGERILGFQLCYDKQGDEHAFTWRAGRGFTHHAIDDGTSTPLARRTPILVPDGVFPLEPVRERFERESGDIDPLVRELVLRRLGEYGDPGAGIE